MIEVFGEYETTCAGVSRRSVLRAGGLALAGLTGFDRLSRRASAKGFDRTKETAVIQVILDGGPSQIETYDPKPNAPAEFRGEFQAIPTVVPGISLSELCPRQARVMDKLAILRSLHHTTSDHSGGTHWVMTGYPSSDATPRGNERPSSGSIAARMLGARRPGLPAYAGIPRAPRFGQAAYLGPGFNPFSLDGDPAATAKVPNLVPPEGLSLDRLDDRRDLLAKLDRIDRRRDASGMMEGMDRFTAEAYAMVTGPAARRAFDLSREEATTRDRYGRTSIGQACLLARRLVEAGVTFVTVTDGGWDHHTQVAPQCRKQLPPLDAAIASLVEDIHDRGLSQKVLLVVWGEFGRTPRVNGAGGRDHWPGCMSALVAGGGLVTGQAVGATNNKGEAPSDRPLRPEDLLRTVYHVLGIDPAAEFPNEAGRPLAVLNQGQPIAELLRG
ncbi:DUF1501 domain-containing protein [Singulisphaera acidiphila]|uniref:DUF1501 domain-containing protein n=3 Tax=Singulisphaera acidiphila TaxID=466153 RepID=L0DPC6_SINAD|nr:DUF1501 domain-containing protein [Singulisphaera acidiphila]AGA30698.1 hypothetical protein Sinac_6623 [Singulisphaera acidiphila DSM 18658]